MPNFYSYLIKSHTNECLRTLVNNPVKENFYKKRKKKKINTLTAFFIF